MLVRSFICAVVLFAFSSAVAAQQCDKPQPGHSDRPKKKCKKFVLPNGKKCFNILLVNPGGHVTDNFTIAAIIEAIPEPVLKRLKDLVPSYVIMEGWAYLVGDRPAVGTNIVVAEAPGSAIAMKRVSATETWVACYSSGSGKVKLKLYHQDGSETEAQPLAERTWAKVVRGEGGQTTVVDRTPFNPEIIPETPDNDFDRWRADIEDEQYKDEVP